MGEGIGRLMGEILPWRKLAVTVRFRREQVTLGEEFVGYWGNKGIFSRTRHGKKKEGFGDSQCATCPQSQRAYTAE